MKRASGFGIAAVVSILLLAIGLVLFEPFIKNFSDLIMHTGNTAACKYSLFSGKSAETCLGEVKIHSDKVELDGKEFMKKGTEGTPNMAKEALAKLLTMCLSEGGGYNSMAFKVENWVYTEAVCLRCFKVNIDEEVGVINGFTDYLKNTKVKGYIPEKKYLEILTRDTDYLKAYIDYGLGFGLAPSEGTFEFKPIQDYDIFFIGLKQGYIPKCVPHPISCVLDFITPFFKNQDTYFAYIVETNKLQNVCDRLVN